MTLRNRKWLGIAVAALGGVLVAAVSSGCGRGTKPDPKTQIARQGYYYTCSMHPQVREPQPGPCPICQMPMVKTELARPRAGNGTAVSEFAPGTVWISPVKQQLIGVRTGSVERRRLEYTIRTTGVIEHDETRLARIAPRFSGWVRELYVAYTGQSVEKGQPLLKVYSPELLATVEEYLLALRAFERLPADAPGEVRESARRLVESARRRLQLWEIGEEEIAEVQRRGAPGEELLIRALVSGHVVRKTAVAGKAFMAGETLYEIGELSHLWVEVFVYEYDLPWLKPGQRARVSVPYWQGRQYESEIGFISPHIDPQTRRGRARLGLENPDHALRPGMWAEVELFVELGERLVVPAAAILDSGARSVVFVAHADGHFEPRTVHTGVRTAEYVEVLHGVREGERVVTSANFLIDSESRLKAAMETMGAGEAHRH
jgi:Cu(I)/Ag(I) efflux system membrane fusion protein